MKLGNKKAFLLSMASILVLFFAAQTALALNYQPLAPLPGITNSSGNVPSLDVYMNGIIMLGIGIATILTVIMMITSGIQYIVQGSNERARRQAYERMTRSALGLLLALASWGLLFTINPALLAGFHPGAVSLSYVPGPANYVPPPGPVSPIGNNIVNVITNQPSSQGNVPIDTSTDISMINTCVGHSVSGTCAPADLTQDGIINSSDANKLVTTASPFDVNRDGIVNFPPQGSSPKVSCYLTINKSNIPPPYPLVLYMNATTTYATWEYTVDPSTYLPVSLIATGVAPPTAGSTATSSTSYPAWCSAVWDPYALTNKWNGNVDQGTYCPLPVMGNHHMAKPYMYEMWMNNFPTECAVVSHGDEPFGYIGAPVASQTPPPNDMWTRFRGVLLDSSIETNEKIDLFRLYQLLIQGTCPYMMKPSDCSVYQGLSSVQKRIIYSTLYQYDLNGDGYANVSLNSSTNKDMQAFKVCKTNDPTPSVGDPCLRADFDHDGILTDNDLVFYRFLDVQVYNPPSNLAISYGVVNSFVNSFNPPPPPSWNSALSSALDPLAFVPFNYTVKDLEGALLIDFTGLNDWQIVDHCMLKNSYRCSLADFNHDSAIDTTDFNMLMNIPPPYDVNASGALEYNP